MELERETEEEKKLEWTHFFSLEYDTCMKTLTMLKF